MGNFFCRSLILFVWSWFVLGLTVGASPGSSPHSKVHPPIAGYAGTGKPDTATFAMGCFWCTQAQFQLLKGVKKVIAGYTGGQAVNPSYKQVCTGATGHAEACNIIYDPSQISYDELLAAFFTAHDPTQLTKQGNDV